MDGGALGRRAPWRVGLLPAIEAAARLWADEIESRVDQDQNISKDLTLWNQQGSHVLRGNIIALPVNNGFLYVESIYIQATEARMPQIKKVVLAMGNRLIYRDTFEEALLDLQGLPVLSASPPATPSATLASAPASAPAPSAPDLRAFSDQLKSLQNQAEQLVRELEALQKQTEKK